MSLPPLVEPAPSLSVDEVRRYSRHLIIPDVAMAGQKRLKQILDRESGVSGWTFHDFRRSASTGMAALHVPQDTIDRVLNHAKGTLAGTYNRYDYLDQKRKALDAWAERVAFIVGDARDAVNVVPRLTAPL